MSVSALQSDELVRAIRQATRRAGVSVGTRLRSERALAEALNIPHARVRQAFRSLVEEGILVQRHGSGTYLHRLPAHESEAQTEAERELDLALEAEELFHWPAHRRGGTEPGRTGGGFDRLGLLDLGLWWEDLAVMSPVQQQVLAAMVRTVEAAGHRLSLHTADYTGTRHRVDQPVLAIRSSDHRRGHIAIRPAWCEGKTHIIGS